MDVDVVNERRSTETETGGDILPESVRPVQINCNILKMTLSLNITIRFRILLWLSPGPVHFPWCTGDLGGHRDGLHGGG